MWERVADLSAVASVVAEGRVRVRATGNPKFADKAVRAPSYFLSAGAGVMAQDTFWIPSRRTMSSTRMTAPCVASLSPLI